MNKKSTTLNGECLFGKVDGVTKMCFRHPPPKLQDCCNSRHTCIKSPLTFEELTALLIRRMQLRPKVERESDSVFLVKISEKPYLQKEGKEEEVPW